MKQNALIKRLGFFGLAALAPITIGSMAKADPFMNINFDGDTAGQQPATNTSTSLPITQPYAIGGYDPDPDPNNGAYESPPTPADGTILVGNPDGMSNAAVFTTDPGNNQIGALWMDTQYSVVSQFVKVSFDVDIKNGPANATAQTKTLNGSGTVGILLGVNDFQAGNSGFDFAAAPTSGSGGVFALRSPDTTNLTSFFNYADNTPYHVELDANYSTGLLDAYVNGNLAASGLVMQSGIVPNANPDETFVFVNGQPGYADTVAVDNIQASVPEPASFGLIAVGALGLLRRRRKTQS